MSAIHSRFWIVALGLTLMMSQTLGQVDPQGSAWNGTARFSHGFRMGRGAGVTEAITTPLLRQTLRQSAHRFVPQGVRHRVPQDYATIQAAINASNDGDTVLVSEGKYMENIRYQGKAIVVASLYVIDGDTSHIEKTIIDGSGSTQADSGSVVYFVNGEDTTSVLCGFTIQGGSGTRNYSSSTGVWWKAGGGVFCRGAGARIVRNIIKGNRVVAQAAFGGGIEAFGVSSPLPYLILEANRIRDNYVESDTIAERTFWGTGGGADIAMHARIVGNVFERDSVVCNSSAVAGAMGFYADPPGSLPTAFIAGNVFRSNFAFCRGTTNGAFGGGVYVGGTGDVTIIDNLLESNTASALYGAHQWTLGGGLMVDDEGYAGYGRKMIIGNQFMNNTVVSSTINFGGGLMMTSTLATVSRNRFENNSALSAPEIVPTRGGAGINIQSCSFRLDNNVFTGNYSGSDGGAMTISGYSKTGKEQTVINNTIVDNHAESHGGGLNVYTASYLVLLNNIFWNDTASSGSEIFDNGISLEHIAHCDVKGGYPGTNNINADPAFVAGDPMFHLMASSPCIESGIDSIQIAPLWYHAPVDDYSGMARPMPVGTPPDIGAQEEQVTMVAYAHNASVDPLTPRKQLDTVHIRAIVENPHQHTISATAFTKDFAIGNIQDSILLYNDGLHGDGMANDSLWGGMFVPITAGVYGVSVSTVDGVAGTSRELHTNTPSFATAGPVKYAGYRYCESCGDTTPAPGADLWVRVGLRNKSSGGIISKVTVRIAAIDTLVDYAGTVPLAYGTMYPVDSTCYSAAAVELIPGFSRAGGSTAAFSIDIFSNGVQFWRDTMRIVLIGVEGEEKSLPTRYALEQNYPNPFNPGTTLRYEVPKSSLVTLRVYDLLGREVALLVNEKKTPGRYEVKFDASGLATGVYLYRLTAGSFVQTRKMLVVK